MVSRTARKRDAISKALAENYPDKKIPWGGLTSLAYNLGVSYSYIIQMAHVEGYETSGTEHTPGGLRGLVMEEVARRWPCMEVPYGGLTALAKEFGVSRQRISQIVTWHGVQTSGHRKKSRLCLVCESDAAKYSRYCEEHRYVTVACPSCGKETTKRPGLVLRSVNQGEEARRRTGASPHANPNAGLFFCKKTCRQERGIALMEEYPDLQAKEVAEIMGVTTGMAYQWRRLMVNAE